MIGEAKMMASPHVARWRQQSLTYLRDRIVGMPQVMFSPPDPTLTKVVSALD